MASKKLVFSIRKVFKHQTEIKPPQKKLNYKLTYNIIENILNLMSKKDKNLKKFRFVIVLLFLPLILFIVLQTNSRQELRTRASGPIWYYYYQYSPAWQTSNCNITSYGCFPTSLAMVLKKFKSGEGYTPLSVARAIGAGCTGGTNLTEQDRAITGYARNQGLQTRVLRGDLSDNIVNYGSKNFNLRLAKDYIDRGFLLIVTGCMRFRNTDDTWSLPKVYPHALVVVEVNPEEKRIKTLDPTQEWKFRDFSVESGIMSCPGLVNGWVSAYALKL
jgi:hypothetical protein